MKTKVLFTAFILLASEIYSQTELSVDIYSRYIWRGMDFGNSSSAQPSVTFETGNFSAGVWGSYSIGGGSEPYSEADILLAYNFATEIGNISLLYTDYFFPDAGLRYFDYRNEGLGAHTLEAGISFAGNETLPINISFYYNFYNDVDNSSYIEASFPMKFENASLSIFAGASLYQSSLYGTERAGLINAGFTLSKLIKITREFSLPVSASYIINPSLEKNYFIVGISL